jgi:hypothetical protein
VPLPRLPLLPHATPTLVKPEQEASREVAGFTPAMMAVSSGEPQGQLVVPPTQRHINLFEDEETACVLTPIFISARPHPSEFFFVGETVTLHLPTSFKPHALLNDECLNDLLPRSLRNLTRMTRVSSRGTSQARRSAT